MKSFWLTIKIIFKDKSRRRLLPGNDKTETTIIVETDSMGRTTATRNIKEYFNTAFDQVQVKIRSGIILN